MFELYIARVMAQSSEGIERRSEQCAARKSRAKETEIALRSRTQTRCMHGFEQCMIERRTSKGAYEALQRDAYTHTQNVRSVHIS